MLRIAPCGVLTRLVASDVCIYDLRPTRLTGHPHCIDSEHAPVHPMAAIITFTIRSPIKRSLTPPSPAERATLHPVSRRGPQRGGYPDGRVDPPVRKNTLQNPDGKVRSGEGAEEREGAGHSFDRHTVSISVFSPPQLQYRNSEYPYEKTALYPSPRLWNPFLYE